MKNIIKTSIVASFLMFGLNQGFAQSNNQEKKKEMKEKQMDKAEKKAEKAYDKDEKEAEKAFDKAQKEQEKNRDKASKSNEGNAFGKNKGDMTGREFGQYRSKMAKNKADETRVRIIETEGRIKRSWLQIITAREVLEENKKNRTLTDDEIKKREQKIFEADRRVKELEIALNASKERLQRAERELMKLNKIND